MHRLYENEDLVVFWNSDKCQHARKCVESSSKTFDFARRPWIDLSKADNPVIWQAIQKCPSGALGCVYKGEVEVKLDRDKSQSVACDRDKQVGECNYRVSGDEWEIYHTGVMPEYKDRGIAKRLVYKILEAAERNGAKVKATCSYAAKLLQEN